MMCVNMQHHERKRDPKIYCMLFAIQNTCIAMPTFFRIPDHRGLLLLNLIEDMGWANIRTYPAAITFFFVDDRWHNSLLY
jgi:hypothetical protein